MIGLNRHIKAGLALALLTGLATGCATTYPYAPRVAEEIPAQVCSGDGDSARCADEYTPDRALNVMTLRLLLHGLLTPPGTLADLSNVYQQR